MGRSLRSRLFTNHLLVLALGMGVAAALSWWAVETLYLNTQRDNLLAQAELAAAALGGQPLAAAAAEPYVQTANVLPGIHTRVLGAQGAVVVGLSATQWAGPVQVPLAENAPEVTAEDLLRRQEIQRALQGQASTAVRRVPTAEGRRVLYAAAPIVESDGTVSGLVYLATPLPATGLPPGMLRGLAAAILVALSLAALAASWLARRIARPVEGVATAAASVSAGDLDLEVPVERGIRELAGLGLAFNQMTKSLRQSNQAKNAFVADVTHELRTPLTVIKGTIETLEDGALNDLVGRGPLLASMQRETERLIRLVNQLLVLVRADAGTLSVSLQPLDLSELAQVRCQQFATLAAERRVALSVNVDGAEPACVFGDRDRLAQVLDNLLDNAIRYSPIGSTVAVELQSERDVWVCAIRDAGPGIPAEHLPFVFERFYRADASRNRQSGGAGLGLAIARALVSAQGGQIRAESPAGGGTTVRFSLPAHANCHGTDDLQTPS